ncbi:hypothetical protein BDN72DRAFT_388490 [Pluteus cervinus]|uniref:Uncharacterized protein n=1 Tax=Pluteus cervinus TaxID=181527 RepID=A0ACD3B288_9AGAR|nr:hypothetical protein BDN72DRAFT_388490 [Pluteus cervinus]
MQNLEEAAAIATEFISSLDNLPAEVQHLLQEIKERDHRCQVLQLEVSRDQETYIRQGLRQPASLTASSPAPSSALGSGSGQDGSGGGGGGEATSTSTPPPNVDSPATPSSLPGRAQLPLRISANYAEIEKLSDEKLALAQRIIELLSRTRNRLDYDLAKVRTLQGESLDDISASAINNTIPNLNKVSPTKRSASTSLYGNLDGLQNPTTQQMTESLRNAYAPTTSSTGEILLLAPTSIANAAAAAQRSSVPAAAVVASPATTTGQNKRRRLGTTTSIKLPSPVPPPVITANFTGTTNAQATNSRSRLARHAQISLTTAEEEESADQDAEGDEEEMELDDGEEDLTLYCLCNKQSYGDMIGCDNPDCPYQWFHIACVGVKMPLPESKWYCPECKVKQPRKGRRK